SSQADFSAVEKRLPAIVKDLLDNWPEDSYGLFYNINFPKLPDSGIKGVKFARQGRGHWVKEFQEFDADRLTHYDPTNLFGRLQRFSPLEEGETGYMMIGDFVDDETDGVAQKADHSLIEDGWITITPCRLDRTDYKELSRHV
nr:hypothetical protein [Bacteroidales bacterium]